MNLLIEAREKTEGFIDTLHEPLRGQEVKVRTYRRRARHDYLRFAEKERDWRQAIGKQLRYVQRNVRRFNN